MKNPFISDVLQLLPLFQRETNRCILQIRTTGWPCKLCCRSTGCGPYLPKCQHFQDDSCPPSDKGCPFDSVETKYIKKKTTKRCQVHYDCDSVIVADGKIPNSGIQCDTGKLGREKSFCCRADETLTETEAINRGSQLPFCD